VKFRSQFSAITVLVTLIMSTNPLTRADILVSNLSEPFRASTPIANPEYWGAQSFHTVGFGVVLDSIEAIVGNGDGPPSVVAELRRATGPLGEIDTTAGGLLTTFTAPDMSGATSVRLFTPNSPVTLDPTTKYWFILGADSGTYDWSYANTNFYTGPGMLGNFADSSDAGVTWNLRDESFPYFIQVNGSTIPEPSSLFVLAVTGLGMIGVLRRRR
jgi:hypothetical protein